MTMTSEDFYKIKIVPRTSSLELLIGRLVQENDISEDFFRMICMKKITFI